LFFPCFFPIFHLTNFHFALLSYVPHVSSTCHLRRLQEFLDLYASLSFTFCFCGFFICYGLFFLFFHSRQIQMVLFYQSVLR
jgi:hypothetical protein